MLSARFFQRLSNSHGQAVIAKSRFTYREKMWSGAVIPYLTQDKKEIHVAEFGVATGKATRWWHQNLPQISRWEGFDTFEGLPEPWRRGGVTVMEEGVFAPDDPASPYPHVPGNPNITWHKGLISDTISALTRSDSELMFVLIDVDLLEPTRDVLNWMLKNGRPGDCIYFDEAFDPFNEGLALSEAEDRGLKYRVIGYTGSSLAIVLI